MAVFTNIAAYKFVPLTDPGPLRGRLLRLCREWQLRGTILLSTEGINLFIAGAHDRVELLLQELRSLPELADLKVKQSQSDHQPFNRMLVRIKREIIAFGVEGIAPARHTAPKIPPRTLKQWLDEGRAITLLDTRNDYEVNLGTFRNALPMGIGHFREFPDAIGKLPAALKDQPVVMFCTGGIRCEKAGPFMEREGFRNVFQLEGGILNYFEQCGGAHYEGECFVFDQRVGVDPALHETGSVVCFACLAPLTPAQQEDSRYVPGRSCPSCFKTPAEQMAAVIARRHDAIRRVTTPLPGSMPYDKYRPITVPGDCDGATLLATLCRVVRHIPESEWKARCLAGLLVDQSRQPVGPDWRVRGGERYSHRFPDMVEPDVAVAIGILHEDEALIVLNKPAPLPMHAGGRFTRNTLQHILNEVYHPEKPKPAHRIDANTTGVVLLTRTRHFASLLQPQFAQGQVEKLYLLRAQGHPVVDAFHCAAPISAEAGEVGTRGVAIEAGLPSRTEFQVLERSSDGTSLMLARPLTGRTNQIRVHLWHLGFPVCGDAVYLQGQQLGTTQTLGVNDAPLCLHSWKVRFVHPLSRKRVEFCAPPPVWAGDSDIINAPESALVPVGK